MPGGALLAGFLKGMARNEREKEARKERSEKMKMDKLLMNYKIKELETKSKMNDFLMNLLGGQNIVTSQGGVSTGTDQGGAPISIGQPDLMPTQPPYKQSPGEILMEGGGGFAGTKPSGGLTDTLASAGMPQIDPMTAAVMKAATGVDLTDIPKFKETTRHNVEMERMSQERLDLAKRPEPETHEYEKGGTTYSVIRDKRTGKELTNPVPIKEQKPLSTETASKLTLSINAQEIAKQARSMVIDPKTGEINKQILFEAAAPMGGVGEGRKLKSMFMDALDARIRAATGAAVTKEEWPAYFRMYLPSPLDLGSPGIIKNKLDRLDKFISSYITTLDPSGSMRKTIKEQSGPQPGTVEGGYRFKGGDPGDPNNWEKVR